MSLFLSPLHCVRSKAAKAHLMMKWNYGREMGWKLHRSFILIGYDSSSSFPFSV